MANESPTHYMKTTSLSQLASVDRGVKIDFRELLWENGQILLQGDSNINATVKQASKQDQELAHCQWLNYPQVNHNISCRTSKQFPDATKEAPRVQHQQPPPKQKQPSIINFSNFLRPATFVNTNPQGAAPDDASLGKVTVTSCRNHPSSKLSTSLKEVDVEHSHDHADCLVTAFAKSRIIDQDLAQTSSRTIGGSRNNKYIELALPSSSVCSGNDPKHRRKRKRKSTGESDYTSEDVEEEESKGVRKPAAARGKRSRTAQVHNLSERKRRDKINEKMRALQQLIPGGSKVDKASMLDEAIQYLKTLQIQVQMMSMGMGMGLFMPPNQMMLPTRIQHMNVPHLPPFSPVITGNGMGFGMGMFEITGHSSGCPLKHQVSLPYPPISGIPMSMPPAPFVPLSG